VGLIDFALFVQRDKETNYFCSKIGGSAAGREFLRCRKPLPSCSLQRLFNLLNAQAVEL
jgi:hypothetical protein